MKFEKGDEVQSVQDASRIGTVVEIGDLHGGIQYYRVNFGGRQRPMVAEDDLRPFVAVDSPIEGLLTGNMGGYAEFQRLMTFQRMLRDKPLSNNIYAFNASRTRFYPYQFRPLLKFLDSPSHRLIIADEVGLGKTIEAGLILTEYRARHDVQRVLVVCPSNLTVKWKLELKRRFDENFDILDTKGIVGFLQEYTEFGGRAKLSGIVSLESMRQQRVLDALEDHSPELDLVIVDEAHHMRNFGRKQRNAGVELSRFAAGMVMLTATPIHLGEENLYSLLNILDDEEFPDLQTFQARATRNRPVVSAQNLMARVPPNVAEAMGILTDSEMRRWARKNPAYNEAVQQMGELAGSQLAEPEKIGIQLEIQRNLADLNLIGHIFSRTRKREVHTNVAQRHAYPIHLEFSDAEERFYKAVVDYVRAKFQRTSGLGGISRFIVMMPERRTASCIPAMVEHYRNEVDSGDFDSEEVLGFVKGGQVGDSLAENLAEARSALGAIINSWDEAGNDTKYDRFLAILRELRSKDRSVKAVVFATFKGTLRYLARRLKNDGFSCRLVSGDVPAARRPDIIEEFKENETIELLLSSRVTSEGLDLQFSNTLFNYDLPWNPMEVEQRIGRLDRIGQESTVIRIYNFWIEGTIEQRILERLYDRIGIFRNSIGDLEDILGEEYQALLTDIFSRELTSEEEMERLQRTEMILDRHRKELDKLNTEAARFLGTDQYFEAEVKRIQANRRYVTGEQLRRFVVDFIRNECPRTRLRVDNKTGVGELIPDRELTAYLRRFGDPAGLTRFLGQNAAGVPVTFESDTAFANSRVEFINVLHPLAQAIHKGYQEHQDSMPHSFHVALKTAELPPDFYFFFVFKVNVHAARESNTLEIVILDQDFKEACTGDAAERILGEMVELGEDPAGGQLEFDHEAVKEGYEAGKSIFLSRVGKTRERLTRSNDAFVERRLGSLKTFFGKRISKEKSLLSRGELEGKDQRYLRMKRSTLDQLEAELDQKIRELEERRQVQVDHDECAAGILEIIA